MKAGELVGDYEILRPLGEGGMATVFVARDTRHDREVVLKAMPPYLNSPAMEARFRREIQSIASLSHPNVVKVLDFSVTSTLAWYVMPYVPAADLEKFAAELRAGAPAPPLKAFGALRTILLDTASALSHCHERGIYHRDIKPQNILVDLSTRRGILSDFGLARAENLTNLTKSREMLGTIRYMSPEMLKGSDVDGPSDVYQLALVTYEIFAGQLPFTASNPFEEIKRLHSEPIPSIRTFNPAVSEELSEFVIRSMSPKIEDRPSSMEIFHEGLKSCPVEHRTSRAQSTPRSITVALSRSQELNQARIQQQLLKQKRIKQVAAGVVGALALAAGAYTLRGDQPRGFRVEPGYQDARVVATGGPRFRLEIADERSTTRTFGVTDDAGGWSALATGLSPGQSYTATWVLDDGRRGSVAFSTKQTGITQLKTRLDGQKLQIAFQTDAPMRARMLKGDEPHGPELDREPSKQHSGEIELAALPGPDLRLALTDAAGATARLDMGALPLPAQVTTDAVAAFESVDIDKFCKEVSQSRWRREGRERLAEHLRTGMFKATFAAAEAFRPLAPVYFASQSVPAAKRMEAYRAITKLYHVDGVLVRESIPLRLDVPGLLGPLAPSPTTRLDGPSALAIKLVEKAKLKFDHTKDLRRLSASVYDTIEAAADKNQPEVSVEREIRGIRDLKKAELVIQIDEAARETYFFVEINGRYRLLFFPPRYAKVFGAGPPLVLHHAFDPRLLEDGPNRFRVGVGSVADFPFTKSSGEIAVVELKAQ